MAWIEWSRMEKITTPLVVLSGNFDKDINKAREEVRKWVDILLLLLWSNNEKPN